MAFEDEGRHVLPVFIYSYKILVGDQVTKVKDQVSQDQVQELDNKD